MQHCKCQATLCYMRLLRAVKVALAVLGLLCRWFLVAKSQPSTTGQAWNKLHLTSLMPCWSMLPTQEHHDPFYCP